MKFAAGLTVSGILGFIVLEVLKLILPTLAAWVLAVLGFAVKILLVGVGLAAAAAVLALAVFLYRRSEKTRETAL
jgi:hypothetical protein